MASGKLGGGSLSAATHTTLYTVPAGVYAVFNVNIVNENATDVTVRLAIGTSATPGTGDYVEYNVTIPASGVLERTGFVAETGMRVIGYTDTTSVAFNVFGVEVSV